MADRNKKNREMGRFLFKWKEPKNKKVMKGAVNYLNMHVQRQDSKYVISLVPVNEWLKDTMQSKTELSVWNMSSGQLVRSCSCTGNLFLLQFLLPPLEHLKFCQWWHKLKKITECCGLSHHDQKNSLHRPMQCSIVQCRFCELGLLQPIKSSLYMIILGHWKTSKNTAIWDPWFTQSRASAIFFP